MLKVALAVFAVARFWGLLDVHECLGFLQMVAYPLGKQTAGCNSRYEWLMSLAMNLAALCNVEVKMAPMDAIWLVLVKM